MNSEMFYLHCCVMIRYYLHTYTIHGYNGLYVYKYNLNKYIHLNIISDYKLYTKIIKRVAEGSKEGGREGVPVVRSGFKQFYTK